MSEDNITVKVSGSSIYRAVKNYLDNSEDMQAIIKKTVEKHLEVAVKGRIQSMLDQMERDVVYKTRTQLDVLIRKEVETKVADYISKGVKKMFEGGT